MLTVTSESREHLSGNVKLAAFRMLGKLSTSMVLSKNEREALHQIVDLAARRPEHFGGYDHSAAARILTATAARLAAKLPRRGSGMY